MTRHLDLFEKLMRTASPKSGATNNERSLAALEAAKIWAEHDLTVKTREKPPRRTSSRPTSPWPKPSWPREQRRPGWVRSYAPFDVFCAQEGCGGLIQEGDPVWVQVTGLEVRYLHGDAPCE